MRIKTLYLHATVGFKVFLFLLSKTQVMKIHPQNQIAPLQTKVLVVKNLNKLQF